METEMEYLIRNKGTKNKTHIWTGEDTACRMWSTGGLASSKGYTVHQGTDGHEICHMCQLVTDSDRILNPLREQLRDKTSG